MFIQIKTIKYRYHIRPLAPLLCSLKITALAVQN